jgi:hypothetical protein|tara:strand:+ start:4800 stop:5672 length:873 start_codon:yes stop_codon:yes gene_type:complete
MFRKLENIQELRLKCQERPEKVNLKLSKYLYRPISIYITYIFLKLSISANFVTLLSILITFLGSFFLLNGGMVNLTIGFFCFWLFYLLDFCDGEIARYNNANSLTGHFFELIAHYIVNILFFLSIGITFYMMTNNFYYLIFSGLGVIGDNIIKLKDAVIWQTICVERLRLTSRNDTSKEEQNKYQVDIDDTQKEEFKKDKSKNLIFEFLKKNILLGHFFANAIYLPFLILSLITLFFSLSLIYLKILFFYTCIINIILSIKILFETIKNKKTEKTFVKFFKTEDKIDFNL